MPLRLAKAEGPRLETGFAAWGLLRLLGAIYLAAFVSLWPQLVGLIGRHGILPAESLLRGVQERYGLERYWLLPTLCWLTGAGNAALVGLCAAGVAASALVIADVAPIVGLVGCWALYLSLASVCREFLWFQWDSLLLEAGFLAIWLAPWRWRGWRVRDPAPSRIAIWLVRWLVFRLMFSSGLVKLASGDPAWRHLTALVYHYETQPLPAWISWYAHHLPAALQRFSCAAMFVVELAVPWTIWGPRRLRHAGCIALMLFQALILATGNYGFFNPLTMILCLSLLDDGVWPRAWVAWWQQRRQQADRPCARRWPAWLVSTVAVALLLLSAIPAMGLARREITPPAWLAAVYASTSPWRLVNGYGLFAVMTTSRAEIILEGSDDGEEWRAYEFRHKPGRLDRRPRWIVPHMPRLDWQMWFAALGSYQQNPWFLQFCQRLLEGSPDVERLLAVNPFPDAPPRFLRATLWAYRFTDAAEHAHGRWWAREPRGLYCPVLSLGVDARGR